MSHPITLSADEVHQVQETLLIAKFALEQDVDGPEKQEALNAINKALDTMRRA